MKIAVLPGDGIGREVTAQGVKVLKAVLGEEHALELHEAPIGGAGFDAAAIRCPLRRSNSRGSATRFCTEPPESPKTKNVCRSRPPDSRCSACGRL